MLKAGSQLPQLGKRELVRGVGRGENGYVIAISRIDSFTL